MVDILHRIGVKDVTPEAAYQAIATRDGIASWWIGGTTGDDTVGGTLDFGADIKAKVAELRPAQRIDWEVVQGPDEWIGTHITFELSRTDEWAIVLFKHEGWKEPVEFMHHCSTKRASFLLSLKKYVETGKGDPSPNDVAISNWP